MVALFIRLSDSQLVRSNANISISAPRRPPLPCFAVSSTFLRLLPFLLLFRGAGISVLFIVLLLENGARERLEARQQVQDLYHRLYTQYTHSLTQVKEMTGWSGYSIHSHESGGMARAESHRVPRLRDEVE